MSPTSTTISAHIDFGVQNAGFGTSEAASHIPAANRGSADLIGGFMAIEFRLHHCADDQRFSACLGSFWDVPGLYKGDGERDGRAAAKEERPAK